MTIDQLKAAIEAIDGKEARANEFPHPGPRKSHWLCRLFHSWEYFNWPPEQFRPWLYRKCLRCNALQLQGTFPWHFWWELDSTTKDLKE